MGKFWPAFFGCTKVAVFRLVAPYRNGPGALNRVSASSQSYRLICIQRARRVMSAAPPESCPHPPLSPFQLRSSSSFSARKTTRATSLYCCWFLHPTVVMARGPAQQLLVAQVLASRGARQLSRWREARFHIARRPSAHARGSRGGQCQQP